MNLDQIDPNSNAQGNTETCAKQGVPCCYWCFTWNNYPIDQIDQIDQTFEILKTECTWYVAQEEKGENGTIHIQGTLKLKIKQRLTALKKIESKIHWEQTKAIKASIAYCSKEATRNGQQWVYGIEIPEPLEYEEPYGWQLQVIDIIKNKPDKRTIHWFWEPNGNIGKTQLCKYLCIKHNALILTGKSTDMFHLLAKHPNKRKLILCNISRENYNYVNYSAIESIKDGLVCSGKYDGAQLIFNSPHVIIFANSEPRYETMSQDRWHVIKIYIT